MTRVPWNSAGQLDEFLEIVDTALKPSSQKLCKRRKLEFLGISNIRQLRGNFRRTYIPRSQGPRTRSGNISKEIFFLQESMVTFTFVLAQRGDFEPIAEQLHCIVAVPTGASLSEPAIGLQLPLAPRVLDVRMGHPKDVPQIPA